MTHDIEYSRDLLKRINNVVVEGTPIHAYFHKYYGSRGHSFWASEQHFLFRDIKKFSTHKKFDVFTASQRRSIVYIFIDWLFSVFALLISLVHVIKLLVVKTKVLTYSVDKLKKDTRHDPRLIKVYRSLEKNNVSYAEVIHTLFGREFLRNLLKRRRSAIYLEASNILFFLFKNRSKQRKYIRDIETVELRQFNDFERQFVHHTLLKYAKGCLSSEFRIALFSLVLKRSSIKIFISIDDIRYGNELLMACRLSNITSHQFQHSNFDYLQSLDTLPASVYAFPDVFYVWNEYWQNTIPKLSPLFSFHSDQLMIGGRAYDFKISDPLPYKTSEKNQLTVLAGYEVNVNKELMSKCFAKIHNCPGISLIFSVRSGMPKEVQIREYGLTEAKDVEIVTSLPDTLLQNTDLVLGVYSGLLDEMVERGKQVGVLKTTYRAFHDLSENDLAEAVDTEASDICDQLQKASRIPKEKILERQKRFTANTGNAGKTVETLLHQAGIIV
jgi:hypothetical protein